MRPFAPGTQLNWLARYLPLRARLDGAAQRSLLEVGSGPVGLSSVAEARFVGVDVKFDWKPVPAMIPFCYGGTRLPFKDGAFHTVVSMDTLEHIPASARPGFLQELRRVAATQVLVGSPTESAAPMQPGDDPVARLAHKLGLEPEWMHEHDEHGLPRPADVEAVLRELPACRFDRMATTNDLVNLLAVLVDLSPGTEATVAPFLQNHAAELEAWFAAGMFGPANRKVYAIECAPATAALVDINVMSTLVAALACPDCGGDCGLSEDRLACRACGKRFFEDEHEVIRLLPTAEARTFAMAPDWIAGAAALAEVVRNFARAFSADDPCRLWLDVDAQRVPTPAAHEAVQAALRPLGRRPVAPIALNSQPGRRPANERVVELPPDARGCTPEWFRAA